MTEPNSSRRRPEETPSDRINDLVNVMSAGDRHFMPRPFRACVVRSGTTYQRDRYQKSVGCVSREFMANAFA